MYWFCLLLTHNEDGLCFLNAVDSAKLYTNDTTHDFKYIPTPTCWHVAINYVAKEQLYTQLLRPPWRGNGIPIGWLIQSCGISNNKWGFESIIFVQGTICNRVMFGLMPAEQFHLHCLGSCELIRLRHVQWSSHHYWSICVRWLPLLGVWTN